MAVTTSHSAQLELLYKHSHGDLDHGLTPTTTASVLRPPDPSQALDVSVKPRPRQCGAGSRRLMWAAAIHSRVNLSEAGSLYSQRDMLCRHVYTSFPLCQSSSLACQ
ncbi:uncharacterized [Tachysurus ichikawai]